MKILFDSHTHINNDGYSEEERAQLIAAIEDSEVAYVMDVGFDLPSSERAVSDAALLPWCYAAVGVHPHDTKTMTEEIYEKIRRLAGQPKVQAIGEIGLDFYYNHSDAEDQRYWFRRQIRLANELHMPIVIHAREADQETMDILKEEGAFSEERCGWFPPRPGTGIGRKAGAQTTQKASRAGEGGVIVTNPPYGERIGDRESIDRIYKIYRRFFETHPTWSLFAITADKSMEAKAFGRPADRRRKLYNGRLEVCYYQFHGQKPPRK